MPMIHKFKVEMACSGCSDAIEKVLSKLGDDINHVEILIDRKLVMVTTDLSKEKVLETIEKAGKETTYLETVTE